MAARLVSISLLRASFLEQLRIVEAIGGVVCIYRVEDGGSRRRGAAGSR
jgi:hypothetical protein